MLIYCDLDEVIADFTGAALEVHGWDRDRLHKNRLLGHWNMATAMGLTDEEFWTPLDKAGVEFWVDIHPLPWAGRVLRLLATNEWYIVTSPSASLTSYAGKLQWLLDHVGRVDNCIITRHKHLLAKEGAVLIDDRESNLHKFEESGGSGILFPSEGNSLHDQAKDPIPELTRKLEGYDALNF